MGIRIVEALVVGIIACFHISTTSVYAAQTAPLPRLAFHVYAVRDACERDFLGTLKAARAMGYEGVETGRFYGRDAKGLKAACDEAGLELVALQLYPHMLTEPQLADTIRFCHDCGAKRINVAWYKGSEENENDWQLLVNVLNHAAEVCAKEGIAVGYHNHDQEFRTRFGDKTAMEWLFGRFSLLVKQEFDPGWCVLAGGDPLAWLAAHPHRNPTVHIMPAGDYAIGSSNDRADWRGIVHALAADGVEWLVVKPTARPDSLADLESSIKYLKGIMK